MIKQTLLTYAFDKNGDFVSVDEVPTGIACNCTCPACHEPLVAKNGGSKRVHHFAHASGVDCGSAYESMLHIIAKQKIQDVFLSNDRFLMQFVHRSFCQKDKSCGYTKYGNCFVSEERNFNLKEYYDSCEQEIPYDNIRRRSDLKIFSSKNQNITPIYIEIFVTHASDQYKLHNGGKIIEVKIESEEDIDRIVREGFVQKCINYYKYDFSEDEISNNQKIEFYGFKTEDNNASMKQEIEFSRYILYASGKSQCYQDTADCNNLVKARKNSLLEICFHTSVALGIYEMAKYQGYKRFGIKNCIYCRNYVESYNGLGMICCRYKYLGLSKWEKLDTSRAKECQCFALNEEEMNEELKHFEKLPTNFYTEL